MVRDAPARLVAQDGPEHRRFIDRLVGPALGSITLRKLRSEDLDRFYARLRKCGGQGGKPLKASSVRRVHVVVHSALAQAVKWRWIPFNLADAASPPTPAKVDIRPPTPEGVHRLLELATEQVPEFGLFLRLAAVTGAQSRRKARSTGWLPMRSR